MFTTHKITIIVALITALISGTGGYMIGSRTSANTLPTSATWTPGDRSGQFGSGMMGGTGTGNTRARMSGGGFTSGTIIAKDDTSITVEARGAQSGTSGTKTVFLAGSTQITKSTEGSLEDLEIGKEVVITGSSNTDGSLTAKTVQLRPENMPAPQSATPQAQ